MSNGTAFEITVRVPWADTDAAAIVWLGNFVKYVECAEEELFRACRYPRAELMRDNIVFPRTTLSCSFRSPARFDDVLTVALNVTAVSERRITFAFDISQKDSKRLVVEGTYEIACVDAVTFKGREVPEYVRTAFAQRVACGP